MRTLRVTVSVLVVAVVLLGLTVALATSQPARADEGGGITGVSNAVTVLDGATAYTTSVNSDAFDARYYGSVQVMAVADVTGTQTMTVTPQFSLENVSCSRAAQWFTSTSYIAYQPYSVLTYSGSVTLTLGTPTAVTLPDWFAITGAGVAGREVSNGGLCFRAAVTFSDEGQTYTPTIVVRGLNRGK
jgi:hypothetical protein